MSSKMLLKRCASPNEAYERKRKLVSRRVPTFENDAVISLGTREVESRMAVLRDRSAYFARLCNGDAPRRFDLTSGDDVNNILDWNLLPALKTRTGEHSVSDDDDAAKRARDAHEAMLELICPTSPRPLIVFQQKDRDFILDVAKLITKFQCNQEVKNLFATGLVFASRNGHLNTDITCLSLEAAFYLKDYDFFSRAISHVVGQSSVFEEELDLLPEELQSIVEKEVEELTQRVGYVMQDIDSVLVQRLAGPHFAVANLIQVYVAKSHGYVALVRQEASPESYAALKCLYELSAADWVRGHEIRYTFEEVDETDSKDGLNTDDLETIRDEYLEAVADLMWDEGSEAVCLLLMWNFKRHIRVWEQNGEDLRHQMRLERRGWSAINFMLNSLDSNNRSHLHRSVMSNCDSGEAMGELLEELYETLEGLFKGDQGMGYFTPIFRGYCPWLADETSKPCSFQEGDADITKGDADMTEGDVDMTDGAAVTQVLAFRPAP